MMKKTVIFTLMICFIVQPLLVLANEPPPPGFSSMEEYNYASQCSRPNPLPGCGRQSSYNESSDWGVGEVLFGIGALWLLGQMAKGTSSPSSRSSSHQSDNH